MIENLEHEGDCTKEYFKSFGKQYKEGGDYIQEKLSPRLMRTQKKQTFTSCFFFSIYKKIIIKRDAFYIQLKVNVNEFPCYGVLIIKSWIIADVKRVQPLLKVEPPHPTPPPTTRRSFWHL